MKGKNNKKKYQSVLEKEAYFSKKSEQAFANFMKETKKHKPEISEFSQTIICGTEKTPKTKKTKR